MCVYMYHGVCEGQWITLWSWLSYFYTGSGDQAQIVRLVWRMCLPNELSHQPFNTVILNNSLYEVKVPWYRVFRLCYYVQAFSD